MPLKTADLRHDFKRIHAKDRKLFQHLGELRSQPPHLASSEQVTAEPFSLYNLVIWFWGEVRLCNPSSVVKQSI